MRLGIIVTEFPKTTETFIQRELVEYHRLGHVVRVYHLTRFKDNETVHEFAKETLSWTRPQPYLFGRKVLGALMRAVGRKPAILTGIIRDIIRGYRSNPVWLLKTLFILPKSLAFAEDLQAWNVSHVHASFASHPATSAWIISRMTGVKYSVSCHAHDIFLTTAMLDTKLGEASFVRPISEFNRKYLLNRVAGLRPEDLKVIHIGLDFSTVSTRRQQHDSECFRILYIGALEVRKGIAILLKALRLAQSHLGEWECVILGGGPERRNLEAFAGQLGLQDRVHFHGQRPNREVWDAILKANVLTVPSIIGPGGRTEGIPTVIVEALAHRTPVIATSLSGIPELVVDGETGYLVPPGDEQKLADAIRVVAKDPDTSLRLAANGYTKVHREFDLAGNVAELLLYFDKHCHERLADREC